MASVGPDLPEVDTAQLEKKPQGPPGPEDPRARRRRIVALVAIACGCLAAFALLAGVLVSNRWASPPDAYINSFVGAVRTPSLTVFMWLVSLPGDPPVIAPITIVAALLLAMWGLRAGAVLLLATMAGEAVVQHFVEVAFARARPPASFALIQLPAAFSFPSGHAWASLLLASVLGLVLWRSLPRNWTIRVAIVAGVAVVALLVGASRLYLGVHWGTDVLGGWIMAVVSFVAVSALYLWVVKRFHIKELDPPLGPLWLRVTATSLGLLLAVGLLAYDARLNPLAPGALKVTELTSTHSNRDEAAVGPQHCLVGREPKCA